MSGQMALLESSDSVELGEQKAEPLSILDGGPVRVRSNAPRFLWQILDRAAAKPTDQGITYVRAEGAEVLEPYAELRESAARIGAGLCELGLKPGDKVILQLEQDREFLAGLWACILQGIVPVPLATVDSDQPSNSQTNRFLHAWRLLDRCTIVATADRRPLLQSLASNLVLESFHVELLEELATGSPSHSRHAGQPDELAILLFTSGSTGPPKGVRLSHRNILSSITGSAYVNNSSVRDISLNWLKLHHIGGLMRSLREAHLGCRQIQVPTQLVLEDPLAWLRLIDHYRVTTSWAPNFAFGLLVDQLAGLSQRQTWDLSCLSSLWSSGEMVVPKTMQRFLELLSPYGLRASAMHVAWGMTEACFATFSHSYLLDLLDGNLRHAPVGAPIPGISLRIVDAQDRVLPERETGHLQIKGPVCASGYYGDLGLDHRAFTPDGWLKTGDLGHVRGNCLTVTGREQDVIIINGVNYSNLEIESLVEENEGVASTFTAACAVRGPDSNTDELAIFFCPSPTGSEELPQLTAQIRRSLVQNMGINPSYLIPISQEAIPKTGIGKIRRAQLIQRFREGEFDALLEGLAADQTTRYVVAPQDELEHQLVQIWEEVLNVQPVGTTEDFYSLGGSSLRAVELFARVEKAFDTDLSLSAFFLTPTIQGLATILREQGSMPPVAHRHVEHRRWRGLRNRILQVLSLYVPGSKTTRVKLHRMRGVSIGENVFIGTSVILETSFPQLISIGNNVSISMRSVIIGHFRETALGAVMGDRPSVIIEDDAFIGPGVIILPNVTIGRGSVVAAGSVVNQSVPPLTLVQGNPAKLIAHCGVPLRGSTYEQFLRRLVPLKE